MSGIVRGSIVWVDLGKPVGSEQGKKRPAVVVSNNGANRSASAVGRGVVTVVPLTTRSGAPLPFQVDLTARETELSTDSLAQAEQVRSVDIQRVSPTGTVLSADRMASIDLALRLHLGIV